MYIIAPILLRLSEYEPNIDCIYWFVKSYNNCKVVDNNIIFIFRLM